MKRSKYKRKQLITLLLAVLLCCTIFSGCSKSGIEPVSDSANKPLESTDSSQVPTTASDPADESAAADEPAGNFSNENQKNASIAAGYDASKPYNGLTVPMGDGDTAFTLYQEMSTAVSKFNYDQNDMPVFQKREEITGVHVDFILSNDFAVQFPLMIASEDWPDMVAADISDFAFDMSQYVEDGIAMDISDIVEKNCPNYQFIRTQDDDTARRTVSDEGKILAFYQIRETAQPSWLGFCTFKDWHDEFGGAEAMDTIDEFADYLRFLRDDKQVEYPLAYTNVLDNALLATVDLHSSGWRVVNGEVQYCFTTDDFKEHITRMKAWYDEGIFNPNFYGMVGSPAFDFDGLYNEKYGVWWNSYICLPIAEKAIKSLYNVDMIQKGIATPTREEGGTRKVWTAHDPTLIAWQMSFIFETCSDPVTLCKWFDWHYTQEGSWISDYGVEGLSWNMGKDGKPVYVDEILHPEDGTGSLTMIYANSIEWQPRLYNWRREVDGILYGSGLEFMDILESNYVDEYSYPGGATRTLEEAETYSTLMSDIETLVQENATKFVIGERSMSEWDDFQASLWQMGLQTCIDIQQAAYDRFMNRDIG